MMTLPELSQFLLNQPAFALALTLGCFATGQWLFQRTGQHPLANPVAVAISAIIVVLLCTDVSYPQYMQGAQFIHLLLGPATVALAVPLYRQWQHLKRLWLPIVAAISCAVASGYYVALLLVEFLQLPTEMGPSLALKSVTVPVAIGIGTKIGAVEPLLIAFVVLTGILGSMVGIAILQRFRVKDHKVIGLAMGVTSHGQGTARAFQLSQSAGAFAGLGMALTAVLASLLLPLLSSGVLG